MEQAKAAYESQIQNVSYSRSRLDLAERDLMNTELRGPFDGTVSARYVEPSEVAARGQHILEVYAEAAMQVSVSVPEQMIDRVHTGDEGKSGAGQSTRTNRLQPLYPRWARPQAPPMLFR